MSQRKGLAWLAPILAPLIRAAVWAVRFAHGFLALCLLASLAGCLAAPEPRNGCLLAVANEREVLRARAFLHPALPGRILHVDFADAPMGHVVLVYRVDGRWYWYDDGTGSTRLLVPDGLTGFPDAAAVARTAFLHRPLRHAFYLD